MSEQIDYEVGSGNVFTDLGFERPEEELAKARMALRINEIIKEQDLTQKEAAKLLGIDQPKVSALKNGRLEGFSLERLISFLTALNLDVDIIIHPKAADKPSGSINVLF